MSSLSGQTIQSTYQGLLKLADSTTGVTSTAQAIQDGLGNDTGLKIATDYFTAPNVVSFNNLKNDYYGLGFVTAASAPAANSQNVLIGAPFYDRGLFSYSAISYNVITATTIGDTIECAFYTTQQIDGVGIGPYQPILSGITLTANSTGFKEDALPSNLSFSAYGPGFYWFVVKVTNSGATPTVRLAAASIEPTALLAPLLGITKNKAGTAVVSLNQSSITSGRAMFSGTTSFPSAFTQSDFANISTTNPQSYGFALKVTRP